MAGFVKNKGSFDGGNTIKAEDTGATGTPAGGTADRPSDPETGDLRFNTDTTLLEVFNGSAFTNVAASGTVTITQDSFTGDGSTVAFTMSTSVESNQTQRIVVAVGNVYQNPASAYTLSGTTITFTSPPGGSETITVIHGYDSNG
tara:strand:- start:28 stop:462 length:435 start_codon:yes stop_codon:yes gene_type:complete